MLKWWKLRKMRWAVRRVAGTRRMERVLDDHILREASTRFPVDPKWFIQRHADSNGRS